MKIDYSFDLGSKVSSTLCILLIMILSLVVAWNVVSKAREITESFPQSKIVNLDLRQKN